MYMSEFKEYQGKDSGFQVPDGYFENKRLKLLAIADEKPSGGKLIRLNFRLVFSGIAAVFIAGLFLFGPRPEAQGSSDLSFEKDELTEFVVSSYNYELNEELILLELSTQDIAELDTLYLSEDDLNSILEEDFDQILNYEYL